MISTARTWTIPGLAESGSEARVLNAALRCFARYGYQRTRMTDIAKEAGVSRTALYNLYPGLEDVFRALSQRVNQGVRQAVIDAAATQGDLTTRLQAVVAARVSWAFDALHLSEHGCELIDAKNDLCGKAGADTEAQFRKLLADIIATSGMAPSAAGAAATVIVKCIPGLLVGQTSEAAARAQVAQFVRIFAAGIEATAPASRTDEPAPKNSRAPASPARRRHAQSAD